MMQNYFNRLFNLRMGEEAKPKVLANIRSNIIFKGPVLWILACAILVASVGLNVNSTAVIIGAMLISPLMGPIIGAGFGLAIYDFILFKRSLKYLLIATLVGLIVSALYFYVSPFKEAQSELLARTSPNIYDVLIAFFGGLAGVIAVTRVEKGLPVAGVAIATALMPPLCTAGYGIGTGNFMYFLGALYLYSINCVFICIATYLIVRFMKYPIARQVDKKHSRQVKYSISAIIFLMIVPSGYFAFQLFQKQRFKQNVDMFVKQEFENKGDIVVYKQSNYSSDPKRIDLAVLSKVFTQDQIDTLEEKMVGYGFTDTKLHIRQDTSFYPSLKDGGNGNLMDEKDLTIARLQKEIEKNNFDNKGLLQEAKTFRPELNDISVANHIFRINDSVSATMPILVYKSQQPLKDTDETQLINWARLRLKLDTLQAFHVATTP